jgi:drug/metabolite transporter (DMT)-like permease
MQAAPLNRSAGNLRSIYMMLIAVVMFSLMDTAMKLLAADFPAMQVASLRALASLPLIVAYVAWRGGFRSILRVHWPLQLLRAGLGIVMLALFAFGVNKTSLAEAYSIFFIAPALITALSVWVLKEHVHAGQWVAIAIGMGGVLVVLRPTGAGVLTVGGLAILGAAACYAVSNVAGRIGARRQQRPDGVLADDPDGDRRHRTGLAGLGAGAARPCAAAVRPGVQRLFRAAGHYRGVRPWRSVAGSAVRVHGAGVGRGHRLGAVAGAAGPLHTYWRRHHHRQRPVPDPA